MCVYISHICSNNLSKRNHDFEREQREIHGGGLGGRKGMGKIMQLYFNFKKI